LSRQAVKLEELAMRLTQLNNTNHTVTHIYHILHTV
jgi:hypothetical protein